MSLPSLSLDGKVAIVTGGRRGIGKAVAVLFAEAGADIALADVVTGEEMEATAKEIQALGRKAIGIKVDTTSKEEIETMVEKTVNALGGVDILVNAAGISTRITPMNIGEEEWDRVFNVNIKANFLACQAVIPGMQKRKFGKIINISSGHGFKGGPQTAHYSAAKAGVVVFTKSLALELAPYGINVNCIAPGITDTDMPHRVLSDEAIQARAAKNPMGRIGTPQDVANMLLFLVSEESSYITGQTIYVNGGDLMPS